MRKIIGIDPGTNFLGYAIITQDKHQYIIDVYGIVNLSKIKNHYERLEKIFSELNMIIQEFGPEEMAIEAPFYGKNAQSMLKLGRAQGIAIAVGIKNNLRITEYSPRKIKQAITGNGNASKYQVAAMIKSILGLKKIPEKYDETDALAVALCHLTQNKFTLTKKTFSNWKDFLKQNPDKIL